MKKQILLLLVLMATTVSWAQQYTITGKVIDAANSEPIPDVDILIEESVFTAMTNASGIFKIEGNLPEGNQFLQVQKQGYINLRLPIILENNRNLNLEAIPLEIDVTAEQLEIGLISLSDNELSGDEDQADVNISGLLTASNDAFFNAAAYDFSATFFRPRGLDSENGKVLINGIEMNKQFNGRPQWSNWGGLNDVQRNREFSIGLAPNEYTFGGLGGTTNMVMRASQYRQGGRLSYASSNRTYTGRIMGSYNSGLTKSGWAYSALVSRRFGEEGYIDGTLYDANSFFFAVEKKLNDKHSLNLTAFYTPNRRGRSTAITNEVYELKGRTYNPNWGYQDGEIRNFRIREIEEPVVMLNHYWDITEKTRLNTNIAYQFGSIANSRIDNGGTRLVIGPEGQESYLGGARNPSPNYYQNLPSYHLRFPDLTATNYQNAYLAEQAFVNDGQLDWEDLYRANAIASANGGNSIYVLQDDVIDDNQFTANTILTSKLTNNITLNGTLNYRYLNSKNYGRIRDLLGGTGYLDVDSFAEDDVTTEGNLAQSDVRNRNRIVGEGDKYKYNYEIDAHVFNAFAQAQFTYNKVDFYIGSQFENTSYQRNGLYENGYYPGKRSFGKSDQVNFTTYGIKGGATYKITGRHLLDFNGGYYTKAPGIRSTFSNARQNNDIVFGIEEEKVKAVDASYIYRSPIIKARLTGYYTHFSNGTDISFFYSQSIQDPSVEDGNAFVQEVLTNIERRNIGGELGIEAQVTPTVKLKAAAAVGQSTYQNNPNLYYTSDDIEGRLSFGNGTTKLKDYHVSGGPERAYQLGFEYRDPDYWWFGATTNYFSNAYVDVSALRRSSAFTTDLDGLPFNDYDPETARSLLQQEELDDYFLVNLVGGKSWRIDDYFVGFFATINNVLDQEYKTGGFEDSRNADYRSLQEENQRDTPLFGNRYFFGYGTTYYLNLYVRF